LEKPNTLSVLVFCRDFAIAIAPSVSKLLSLRLNFCSLLLRDKTSAMSFAASFQMLLLEKPNTVRVV